MTLFVDCNNSKFSFIHVGNPQSKVLYLQKIEAFKMYFENDSNLSCVIFKNLPEIGDGFMIFKAAHAPNNFTVHIRCTIQDSKSNCLLLKNLNLPISSSFLPESVKSKAKRILECLKVNIEHEKRLSNQFHVLK